MPTATYPAVVRTLRIAGEPGSRRKGSASAAEPDDAALLQQVSGGSQKALSLLFDRHGRTVFGIALRLVRDRETAEEITQDVFTSVWSKVHTYRADRSKVATWISRITRNRAIDELRRRSSRLDQRSLSWESATEDEPAAGTTPEEGAELAADRQRVRSALSTLPGEQREALALAFFRGYSHSEIAAALRQPLGTVKTRIRTAMQKLRELLAEGEGPE